MLDYRGFSAWITVDDLELVEFEPRINEAEHTVICWIAGVPGKPFIVNWRDHGSDVDSASQIIIDGHEASGQFLHGRGEELRRGVRVDDTTIRPFVFSTIGSAHPTGPIDKSIGCIVLDIRLVKRHELCEPDEIRAAPTGINRGRRPEGDIAVGFGDAQRMSARQKTWRCEPLDPDHPEEWVKFIFRYRTKGKNTNMSLATRTAISPDEFPNIPNINRQNRYRLQLSYVSSASKSNTNPPFVYRLLNVQLPHRLTRHKKTAEWVFWSCSGPCRYASDIGRRTLTLRHMVSSPLAVRGASAVRSLAGLRATSMSSTPPSRLSSLPSYATVTASRLKSLYSDFTFQKQSNPTSYASNVEWWRSTLETALWQSILSDGPVASTSSDRLVLHAQGLAFADRFRLDGVGKPLGIPTVIVSIPMSCASNILIGASYQYSKALIPVPEFLSSARSIYDPGWMPYRIASFVVGKPLWWALGQLGVVDSHGAAFGDSGAAERWRKVRGDYVFVSLLEATAEQIIERQRAKSTGQVTDCLYNVESFRAEFAACTHDGTPFSALDVKVILKYLERDKGVIVVIKFVDEGSSDATDVTAVDNGLLALKMAVDKLHTQVENVQRRMDERTQQASNALRHKRQETAMSYLRSRKQLQEVLKKRLISLELLQSTLLRVETSAGDIEIMKSYESSTSTLREILSHSLLQREKIDETMDALAAANADAREVNDAIQTNAEIAQGDVAIDDSELEAELQALIREAEVDKSQVQSDRLNQPELVPPDHTPADKTEGAEKERVLLAS
ncbi:uncharacterized protein BXZ73DRAFT_36916 [Epithele typhae]|uniref:uncharacterized protein n=1 Tax=Epithele typhae TaxID=378194 RepID=UPI002008BE05|nr:uncharacterized protein BXZ73DRAFT_36916 [Epithele typhae]KAH9946121.1 hypothetical protein BXZ73DRAFT_36916 [Epithele typhae]